MLNTLTSTVRRSMLFHLPILVYISSRRLPTHKKYDVLVLAFKALSATFVVHLRVQSFVFDSSLHRMIMYAHSYTVESIAVKTRDIGISSIVTLLETCSAGATDVKRVSASLAWHNYFT